MVDEFFSQAQARDMMMDDELSNLAQSQLKEGSEDS